MASVEDEPMQIIDNRTREEILQDSVNQAANVCRKHAYRDFADLENSHYLQNYDNTYFAVAYAVLAFRKAAQLHPHLREC